MNGKNVGNTLILTISFVLGLSSGIMYSGSESTIKTLASSPEIKYVKELKTNREMLAKEIIQDVPESSPLTFENKKEIVAYYKETYIPKEGCSLIDLPKDSDIHYTPPKPKVKSKKQSSNSHKKQITTKQKNHKGNSISMTKKERDWLEKLVEAEATGESYEGKLAVATVIANRVESPSFPDTVMGVIKQVYNGRHQFSPWDDGRIYKMTPSSDTKKAVTEVFDNGVRNLPKETAYFAMKNIAFNDWQGKTRKHITTIGVHAFFSEHPK